MLRLLTVTCFPGVTDAEGLIEQVTGEDAGGRLLHLVSAMTQRPTRKGTSDNFYPSPWPRFKDLLASFDEMEENGEGLVRVIWCVLLIG